MFKLFFQFNFFFELPSYHTDFERYIGVHTVKLKTKQKVSHVKKNVASTVQKIAGLME